MIGKYFFQRRPNPRNSCYSSNIRAIFVYYNNNIGRIMEKAANIFLVNRSWRFIIIICENIF